MWRIYMLYDTRRKIFVENNMFGSDVKLGM